MTVIVALAVLFFMALGLAKREQAPGEASGQQRWAFVAHLLLVGIGLATVLLALARNRPVAAAGAAAFVTALAVAIVWDVVKRRRDS